MPKRKPPAVCDACGGVGTLVDMTAAPPEAVPCVECGGSGVVDDGADS